MTAGADSLVLAFYEAMRRWGSQRDSDPNRLNTHDLVEQVFASHGLHIEAESVAPYIGLTKRLSERRCQNYGMGDDCTCDTCTARSILQESVKR